jgi:hypothetical protein
VAIGLRPIASPLNADAVSSSAVECEGAPRDLGFDQGAACAGVLRATRAAQRLLERTTRGSDAALARDLRRHFPRQAEILAGISAAAGVPRAWLERMLARELAAAESAPAGSWAVAAGAALTAGAGLVARSLAGARIVRRRRPEGGFRSVEVTRPWLGTALAGVNERGLAAAALEAPGGAVGECAAPAALLIQDCLERFESLDAVLDWCTGRPGGGAATLLLADAAGEVAGVEIAGAARRVLRPAEGLLLAGEDASQAGERAKRLREAAPLGAELLAGGRFTESESVVLDARARCLRLGGAEFSA